MKNSLRFPALLTLAVALLAPLPAQTPAAGPTRIAVVDVNAVLANSTAGKAAFDKLKKLQEERMAQAKAMDEKIRQLEAKAKASQAANTPELQEQVANQRIAMQRFTQDADREIGEARDRELASLESRIKPVIETIAAEMGLDAIFNKYESGLVFAAPRIDVTDVIIQRFNARKP